MSGEFSVAVLAGSESLAEWQASALERLLTERDVEVDLVVTDRRTRERSPVETLRRVIELREWGLVAGVCRLKARVDGELPAMQPRPLSTVPGVEHADRVGCVPATVDGWKTALPDDVVARLRETDVAIRYGFGFLTGAALDAPQYGVLSFHHGDLREYRGQPMGFWEYVNGEPEAGVTLQRLSETLDGGEIAALERVDISDAATWGEVKTRLFDASEPMLAEAVERLRSDRPLDQPDTLGTLYTHPRGRPVATYVARTVAGLLSEKPGSVDFLR